MVRCILVATSAVCLAGCFGVSVEQCNDYAIQLQNSSDAAQVVKTYIGYRDGAAVYSNGRQKTSESIERSCWSNSLRRRDVNYTCLNEKNTTDECILYRRNNKVESELNFFDFKRFLPVGSKIKTEADFKLAINYYDANMKACNEQTEVTATEKQGCRDKVVNDVRAFSKYGLKPCNTQITTEYRAMLNEEIERYQYLTNHDPYEHYKNWVAQTGIAHREIQWSMYVPVITKDEATAILKRNIKEWGNEHLCDTSNYVNDLSHLGFDLD